jgi:hypothetical protein
VILQLLGYLSAMSVGVNLCGCGVCGSCEIKRPPAEAGGVAQCPEVTGDGDGDAAGTGTKTIGVAEVIPFPS